MRSVNLLIKPASSRCNLRCRYCFYEDEAQNRTQQDMGMMTAETAERLLAAAYALGAFAVGAYMYKKYNHEFLYYV